VSGDADWRIGAGFALHAKIRHVAGSVQYSRNAPLVKDTLDAFTVADLRLRWESAGGGAEVYVGADNVFDADYEEEYALPQSGRLMYGGVRFTF
jgi:outer membrane receptor protein involved in Fe transport